MSEKIDDLAQKIDDQKAAEIFSASSVAFILTDPKQDDNPIIYVNQAFEKLTGYSAEAAIGRNCRFLQNDNTDKKKVKKLREAIDNHEDHSLVLENQRSNGETFLNALVVSPVFDNETEDEGAGKPPRYFLGMQREVSKDYESDQLKQFETAISEVQHRVKNHLAMILGLIRMKTREMSDGEELGDISRRIQSLQLLYEEMSAARQHTNEDVIELGAYIGRVANAIAHLDGRPGIRVNLDVVPIKVQTDQAARIGLIISEILTNAMQHAFKDQETGFVELRVVETASKGLRVTISDDGAGIPEGVDWPNDGGLGSRIVRGLVDGLGGSLDVTRPELGTVIVFDIANLKKNN